MKVIIKESSGRETKLNFKWNGSEFVAIGNPFNPAFQKIMITPYDMKLRGITKSGLQVGIYDKNVMDVTATIKLN